MLPAVVLSLCFASWLNVAAAAFPKGDQQNSWETGLGDLIVAFPSTKLNSSEEHMALVRASRAWRKGVRAFIAVNYPVDDELVAEGQHHNELYAYFPDYFEGRSQYPGDSRAALAPLLAHDALVGQYKWILYGDDDTLWFMNGVVELLQKFDPKMPYIVTDSAYWHHWSGPAHDRFDVDGPPQCLPCTFDASKWEEAPGAMFTPPIGCPCQPQLLCAADQRHIIDPACEFPAHNDPVYSIDGGAGAIISHGLLEKLNEQQMTDCVLGETGTAGDHLFSNCMWQAGFAMTAPLFDRMPSSVPADERLFNPGIFDKLVHDGSRTEIITHLLWAIERNEAACNTACRDHLSRLVSLHLKSRHMPNQASAALLVKSISELHDSFLYSMGKGSLTKPLAPTHTFAASFKALQSGKLGQLWKHFSPARLAAYLGASKHGSPNEPEE